MPGGTLVHRFGSFELDPISGRLFRGRRRVRLSDPQSAMLVLLVANAGHVVSKNALADAGWGHVSVNENSTKQAISRLRKVLAAEQDGALYIETIPNRGYRFAAPVERGERQQTDAPADVQLAPFRLCGQAQRDLNTLTRDGIQRARRAFEQVLREAPDYAPAHIGLANACALTFEATRFDATCDVAALTVAIDHARQATVLAPSCGDAWSTLAFALCLNGEADEAIAAAHKAVALEPNDWRHLLRLAYVSWGEERVRAARAVLTLCPGLALAYWLMATVFIARGAFDAALDVLRVGCAAQDAESTAPGGFPAVGLHLLHALVLAAQHRFDEAAAELACELSSTDRGHLYARECEANTRYAFGALHLRQGRRDEALFAFRRALDVAPGHLFSAAALRIATPYLPGSRDPRAMDAAVARSVALARDGRHADAAQIYRTALANAPLPAAGWLLPVEPLLDPAAHPQAWASVLAIVRRRAA